MAAEVKTTAMAKFVKQLKAWRDRNGWSQAELARNLGYSASLISQIETLFKPPSAEFAAKCDEAFRTPETFADLQELAAREAVPSYFAPVIDYEKKATQVHEWSPIVVPGLAQTEDYARSVIQAGQPWLTGEEADRKVSARMERQQAITREARRPRYWTVLHEGVLRHVVGSPEVMRGQVDRLIATAALPNVVLQVLPYTANDHPGTDGPVKVFDFPGSPSVAYSECNGGGMITETPEHVTDLMATINLIRAAALSPRESQELLRKIRDEIA